MNTTENNKSETNRLIAEFMQVEVQDEVYFILPQFPYSNQLTDYNTYDFYKKETLEYYKNWNWLMEVVEKIESLSFEVTILKNECTIRDNGMIDFDFDRTYCVPTKIEAVYNACIKFIKWYNEQN